MNYKKRFTLKTIAATLAALSMMSTVSMAAGAAEMTDTAVQSDIISETGSIITEETAASTDTVQTDITAETTDIPAADEGTAPTETTETDPSLQTAADTSAEELPADKTALTYTITFDTDGGTAIDPITAEAGTAVIAPDDPVKDGFYFVCWSEPIPDIMPEQDMTITAVWSDTAPGSEIVDTSDLTLVDASGNEISPADFPAAPDASLPSSALMESQVCYFAANDMNDTDAAALELTKEVGIEMADQSFEAISELVPGSRILLAPLKVLFHKGVDNPDPMAIMDEKLNNIDNKLDKLEKKLEDLNDNARRNTEWLGREIKNVSDMSDVKKAFKDLAPEARDLCRDIRGKEINTHYTNNYEKTLMIARLGESPTYKAVSKYVYTIENHMFGGGVEYANLFEAAYNLMEGKRMVSREAYEDAKTVVDELIIEYFSAVALMQEVETAQRAVEKFTDYEVSQMSPSIKAKYEDYVVNSMERMALNYGDPAKALTATAYGYKDFEKKYNNTDFVNKGACRKPLSVYVRALHLSMKDQFSSNPGYDAYDLGSYECKGNDRQKVDYFNNTKSSLTQKEIQALYEYVRDERSGMSLMEFFEKFGVSVDRQCVCYSDEPFYLVTDAGVVESIKDDGEKDLDSFSHEEYTKHTYALKKAFDANANTFKEETVTIAYARQAKVYCGIFGIEPVPHSRRFFDNKCVVLNFLLFN